MGKRSKRVKQMSPEQWAKLEQARREWVGKIGAFDRKKVSVQFPRRMLVDRILDTGDVFLQNEPGDSPGHRRIVPLFFLASCEIVGSEWDYEGREGV